MIIKGCFALLLSFFSTFFGLIDSFENYQHGGVDLYITPRNVNYGWYDNGVFQFGLNYKSVKVPFEKRTFTVKTEKDSVYELYYCRIPKFKCDLKVSDKYIEMGKKRILILEHQAASIDTIFIDTNFNLISNNKCYAITDQSKMRLLKLMPQELKDSWMYDLPPR